MEVIDLPNAKGLFLLRAKSHETARDFKANGHAVRMVNLRVMNSTFP
jgi:hypothetical protein